MPRKSAELKARLLWPAAILLRGIVRVLGRSYRYQVLHESRLAALLEDPRPVVICLWHDQSLPAMYFLYRRLHRAGFDLTLMASQSRDGELITRLARPWKFRVIRGSATRGGQQAMRALHRGLVQHASSPVVIPDGPHGPQFHFKPGAVMLAQFAQVPILPLAFAAPRPRRIRSWDRMMIPRFRSRVVVNIGELQLFPRRMSEEEREAHRARMERMLTDLAIEAAAVAEGR